MMSLLMRFKFYAWGHPAVTATHATTLELTKETSLSKSGDCIVGVGSSVGPKDLPQDVKTALCAGQTRVHLTLSLHGHHFLVEGHGASGLSLSHPTDFVTRKSRFVSDRTLMVEANVAAVDMPRSFVELLQDPQERLLVEITVYP